MSLNNNFPPGAMLYSQGFGSTSANVCFPHVDIRNPSTSDVSYPIGKRWINTANNGSFVLTSFSNTGGVTTANWQSTNTDGGTGVFSSLTVDPGPTDLTGTVTVTTGPLNLTGNASFQDGLFFVSGGNYQLSGQDPFLIGQTSMTMEVISGPFDLQADDITIGNPGSTIVLDGIVSGPSAPLVISGDVTINGGNTLINNNFTTTGGVVTLSGTAVTLFTTSSIQLNGGGATSTSISTATVDIGDITTTAITLTSLNNTFNGASNFYSDIEIFTGNLFVDAGNVVLGTPGNKILIQTGTNASVGTSGAMTAGAVTVNTTAVTAFSKIFVIPKALGTVTAPQAAYISAIVAGTSFTITSADGSDTSTWDYWIIN